MAGEGCVSFTEAHLVVFARLRGIEDRDGLVGTPIRESQIASEMLLCCSALDEVTLTIPYLH